MTTKNLDEYKSEVDKHILSIHGIDLSKQAADMDRLEYAMKEGIDPIDIAIEFDPKNCLDDE